MSLRLEPPSWRPGERRAGTRSGAAPPWRRPAVGGLSGVAAAGELGGLGLRLVARFLHDRRHVGVGDEALPALLVPVEYDPDAVVLGGVAEDQRALGAVLLALLGALGGEDVQEAVEVLDLCRREQHVELLSSGVVVRRWVVRRGQAESAGMSTRASCGSIAPRLSTISNRPFWAWAMYMCMRTWCWPGTIAAGPPGPSVIRA